MANREVLMALQGRLADRLQTAKSEGLSIAWLAVKAGGLNYLFPLAQSGEIFPLPHVQVVPYTQHWFLGVTSLRGGLHGVVDWTAYLGHGTAPARSDAQPLKASVITFSQDLDLNCALKVEALAGLRHAEDFVTILAPAPDAPPFFGSLYQDKEGHNWQEINLQLLAQQPQFLSINA